MAASFQDELRNYWRIIENVTEILLKQDCIKDKMLFNSGFQSNFLQTTNERIAATYEKYLNEERLLRTRFTVTNANVQRNQNIRINLSADDSETSDTSTHQSNRYTVFNDTLDINQKPLSYEHHTVWPKKLNCQNSVATDHTTQSSNISKSQHKMVHTSDKLNDSNSATNLKHIISDLENTMSQAQPFVPIRISSDAEADANIKNAPGKDVQDNYDLIQLGKALEKCVDVGDILLSIDAIAHAIELKSQMNNVATKTTDGNLGQASASQTTLNDDTTTGNNNLIDFDNLTDSQTDSDCIVKIDLTLDRDIRPINQSVIVASGIIRNNDDASKSTDVRQNKRKHVTFMDDENSEKKRKLVGDSTIVNKLDNLSLATEPVVDINSENVYKCNICSKEFNRNTKLLSHMKTHEQKHLACPFKCSVCNREFSDEKIWKLHENSCTLRRYECYLCKKRPSSKTALFEHMRTHTGAKPFSCSECPNSFASNLGLQRHKKKQHKKSKQTVVNNVDLIAK